MDIHLYICSAEKNRVNKSEYLQNNFTISGRLKETTSATNPVITIEKENNPLQYNYNYMYIPQFKRYYFIDDIRNVSNKLWEISGSVDVLFSFMNDIRVSRAITNKSQLLANANVYLNDGSFVMDSRKYNEVKVFPNGFNDNGQYILICAGGA